MNNTVNQKIDPFKYSAKSSFFGSLAYAVLIAYLPIALFWELDTMPLEALSIGVIALCAFTLWKITGNKRPVVTFLTPVVIFLVFGSSFILFALFASLIGAVPLLACLLSKANSFAARIFPLLMSAAVYVGVSLWLGSFYVSAVCLAFLPAAIILAVCISKKASRVLTVVSVSTGILLVPAASVCVWLFALKGGDISALTDMIEYARALLTDTLSEAIAAVGIQNEHINVLSKSAVNLMFNLLPAVIITSSNLLAFAFQSFAASLVARENDDRETLISLYSFNMSTASAVVFLSFLILWAVFDYEDSPALATAAMNVIIILTPGLLYTAVLAVKRLVFSKAPSCFGVLIYIGVISLILRMPEYAIMGGAMVGAAVIIINAARTSIANAGYKKQ